MGVRLPDVHCDAKQMIEEVLDSKQLTVRLYGSLSANPCDVTHFHIEDVDNPESEANLNLTLTYKERVISKTDRFEVVEKTQNLKVLNNHTDDLWSFNMVNKIWDGDYPSSVAINIETGVVYLFNLRVSGLELTEFGKLTEKEFEAFKEDWNERAPFKIKLDEGAMFKFIDGAEGYNHLRRNIFIEFDCIVKLRVYPREVVIL